MTLAETIKSLRKQADLSQASLAEILGVDRSAVAQWENSISEPRMGNIRKLASYFGIPVSSLIDTDSAVDGARAPLIPLRTLGKVHAGSFSDEDPAEGEVEVPASIIARHPSAAAAIVEGDCMNRVVPAGVAVVYDPDMEPVNGQIVIVETEDHEALIRRWYRGGNTLMLVADSYQGYEDIVIKGEQPIRLIGTVVWMQSTLENLS